MFRGFHELHALLEDFGCVAGMELGIAKGVSNTALGLNLGATENRNSKVALRSSKKPNQLLSELIVFPFIIPTILYHFLFILF